MKQLAFVPAFALLACCLCSPPLFAEAPAPLSDEEFLKLARNGTPEEVMRAVKNGANPNARGHEDMTPLLAAAKNDADPKVVAALLKAGADVDAKDKDGETALMRALVWCRWDRTETVNMLLAAGADVNAKSNQGYTALMGAALIDAGPGSEMIRRLLKAGADVNAKAGTGQTALLFAAYKNSPEVIHLLLDAAADVNAQDEAGHTALMEAAFNSDDPDVVKLLLAAGADVSAKDKEGHDALWYAEHSNDWRNGLKEDERREVDKAIIQLLEEAMKNAKAR